MAKETIEGYVARDISEDLYVFDYKPHRTDGIFFPCGDTALRLDKSLFPEINYKNSPVKVKLTIETV